MIWEFCFKTVGLGKHLGIQSYIGFPYRYVIAFPFHSITGILYSGIVHSSMHMHDFTDIFPQPLHDVTAVARNDDIYVQYGNEYNSNHLNVVVSDREITVY